VRNRQHYSGASLERPLVARSTRYCDITETTYSRAPSPGKDVGGEDRVYLFSTGGVVLISAIEETHLGEEAEGAGVPVPGLFEVAGMAGALDGGELAAGDAFLEGEDGFVGAVLAAGDDQRGGFGAIEEPLGVSRMGPEGAQDLYDALGCSWLARTPA